MIKEKFIGTWKLLSSKAQVVDSEVSTEITYPHGKDAFGLLVYTAQGYMSAYIQKANRPKFTTMDPNNPDMKTLYAAFVGMIAYCGPYKINEAENIVTHYPEGYFIPNYEGVEQKREYSFTEDGNQLILQATLPSMADNKTLMRYKLTWLRL